MNKQLVKQAFFLGYQHALALLDKHAAVIPIPGPSTAPQKPASPPVWTNPQFSDRWMANYGNANDAQRQTMMSKLDANRPTDNPQLAERYDAFANNLRDWAKQPNGPGIYGSTVREIGQRNNPNAPQQTQSSTAPGQSNSGMLPDDWDPWAEIEAQNMAMSKSPAPQPKTSPTSSPAATAPRVPRQYSGSRIAPRTVS